MEAIFQYPALLHYPDRKYQTILFLSSLLSPHQQAYLAFLHKQIYMQGQLLRAAKNRNCYLF